MAISIHPNYSGDAEQTGRKYHVHPSTPENWHAKGYIHAFRDQHGRILYDWHEIEAGFVTYGPTKMRDGRKRNGRRVIDVVLPQVVRTEGVD